MADYIDRDELLKKAYVFDTQSNMQWVSMKDIKSMPSVDAVEQKHGHWVKVNKNDLIQCSNCHHILYVLDVDFKFPSVKYCPHCGSKMDEVTEDGIQAILQG